MSGTVDFRPLLGKPRGEAGLIVSLFPTPLSNATTVNGVIVISGRGADNPRAFRASPPLRFNVEVCRLPVAIALLSNCS